MQSPVREAMSDRFASYDELAAQVLTAWRDRDPRADVPAVRSLGAKIGLIDKGEVVWWTRRHHAAAALCEVLEASPEDLGLHAQSGPQLISSVEFPELPPFDPRRETVLVLATARNRDGKDRHSDLDFWLGDLHRGLRNQPTSMNWMTMPIGTGRGFLLHRLIARGVEVLRVRTLADAADRLSQPSPFVVAPEQSEHDGDLDVLAKRPAHTGLLVVAAHAPPVPPELPTGRMGFSWEFRNATPAQRLVVNNVLLGDYLQVWSWVLAPDWRDRFVRWIERRLERFAVDTLFSAQGVLGWLERFDAESRWLRTPGDLLPLCRLAHRRGERGLPDPSGKGFADGLIGEIVHGAAEPGSTYGPWLAQHGVEAFRSLALRRWRAAEVSWESGLLPDAWSRLSGQVDGPVAAGALLAVARAASIEDREALARGLAEKQVDLVPLRATHLLTRRADGLDDLHPRRVADLVVRDALLDAVTNDDLQSWATACLDPERRPFLDAVLDVVPNDVVEDLARSFAERPTWDMATLGAEEALFIAIGRRLARGQKPEGPPSVELARRVLGRLPPAPIGQPPSPWTRPGVGSGDEGIDWVAACWAWSLHLPSERATDRPDLVWLMPVNVVDLPSYPAWLSDLLPDMVPERQQHREQAERPAHRRLLDTAYALVMRCTLPAAEAPTWWCPALLAASALGRLDVNPTWWEHVAEYDWANEELIRRLSVLSPAECVVAVRQLWPSLVRWSQERGKRADLTMVSTFPIWRWLFDHLTEETIAESLSVSDFVSLAGNLAHLPPHLRPALLRQMAEISEFRQPAGLRKLAEGAGPAMAPVLPLWLGFERTRALAAQLLWRWDPTTARRCVANSQEARDTRWALVVLCPSTKVGEIARFAEEILSPDEIAEWVQVHLPVSGANGPTLLQLLARARDARSTDSTP